jgi:predicted transcriptional regulator
MAKSDAKKRAEMIAKEWKKSKSTMKSVNKLVEMGHLHNQELGS